jgi:hypothetical protein
MPTEWGRGLPPCRLEVIDAAATECGRYLALPGCRLRRRWTELYDALVEWSNCWPDPAPTAAEWAALVAAMRQARQDEALARAAAGG